jgi:hypothetical protein
MEINVLAIEAGLDLFKLMLLKELVLNRPLNQPLNN